MTMGHRKDLFTIIKHKSWVVRLYTKLGRIFFHQRIDKQPVPDRIKAMCVHILCGHKFSFTWMAGSAWLKVLQAFQLSFLSWNFLHFQHHKQFSMYTELIARLLQYTKAADFGPHLTLVLG